MSIISLTVIIAVSIYNKHYYINFYHRLVSSSLFYDQLQPVFVFVLLQARQRGGRAGREGPGCCYRLYTEESFEGERRKVITFLCYVKKKKK